MGKRVGVVLEDGFGRVKVYIPNQDMPAAFGSWKFFGKAAGNCIDKVALDELRARCHYATVQSPLTSGGIGHYNEDTGNATVSDSYRAAGREPDLDRNINPALPYSQPGEGRGFNLGQTDCVQNFVATYTIDDTAGSILNRERDKPKGSFVKLRTGQRVIVGDMAQGTGKVIEGNYPYEGEGDSLVNLR